MRFEDTKLPDHPLLRQAVAIARAQKRLDYDLEVAQILSEAGAAPETIAAAFWMSPEERKALSPAVAQIWEAAFAARLSSEPGRQLFLALHIRGMRQTQYYIKKPGHYWGARAAQYDIDKGAKLLLKEADKTALPALAARARAETAKAQEILDGKIARLHAATTFEKTGLPDHPTLRAAYALIRDAEIKNDPLLLNFSQSGARAAKMLIDTGASSDPDVLGAALLHLHHPSIRDVRIPKSLQNDFSEAALKKKNEMYAAAEKRGIAAMRKTFPPRLMDIYLDSANFARNHGVRSDAPETVVITAAHFLDILESETRFFQKANAKLHDKDFFIQREGVKMLQRIENWKNDYVDPMIVKIDALGVDAPGLRARMQDASDAAGRIMNAPANRIIRKPGSPWQDFDGW